MATAGLFELIRSPPLRRSPLLREKDVYPTRLDLPIRETLSEAAIALDCYGRSVEGYDHMLLSLRNATQLILDAYSFMDKENETRERCTFIHLFRSIFPELEKENTSVLALILAEKTRDLSEKLANPEKLTREERMGLAYKLVDISDAIHREQYRAI